MSFYDRYDSKLGARDRLTSRFEYSKDPSSKRKGNLDDTSIGKGLDALRPISKYKEKRRVDSVLGYIGGPLNPKQLMLNDMGQAGSQHSRGNIFSSSKTGGTSSKEI